MTFGKQAGTREAVFRLTHQGQRRGLGAESDIYDIFFVDIGETTAAKSPGIAPPMFQHTKYNEDTTNESASVACSKVRL